MLESHSTIKQFVKITIVLKFISKFMSAVLLGSQKILTVVVINFIVFIPEIKRIFQYFL